MNRYDKIKSAIESMSTADIVALHNEYCSQYGSMDDYVYNMDEFNEIMDGSTPTYIVQRIQYGDFNIADDYFCFNGYGNLVSFDSWKEDKARIYPSDIADYIDHNETDLGNDDIAEILSESEDEEE